MEEETEEHLEEAHPELTCNYEVRTTDNVSINAPVFSRGDSLQVFLADLSFFVLQKPLFSKICLMTHKSRKS